MSVFSWSRRPSAPDTAASTSNLPPPRPRTTSGGGFAALAGSVLSLSKAKSRERLRTTTKSSSHRQTVVSTESESSVWPNEPTTPSDTKGSFQGIVGMVGDDPFARPPVFVSKDESPIPSLSAFPDPPPRRNQLLLPPLASPKSASLSPSRTSSPNRSRSTSASSEFTSNPPSKSPRTPPPLITSVSDMHAHADAFSWTESIYDDRPIDPEPSIRRGQSAHAILAPSARLTTPRLVHSASSSHLSSSSSSASLSGRAGSSAVPGMGSMTALASGIVQGLEDGETRKKPPKRPSRSELRCVQEFLFYSLFYTVKPIPPIPLSHRASSHRLCSSEAVLALFSQISSLQHAKSPVWFIPSSYFGSTDDLLAVYVPARHSTRGNPGNRDPPTRKSSLLALRAADPTRTLEAGPSEPTRTPRPVRPPESPRARTTSSPTPRSPRLGPVSPRLPSSPRLSSPRLPSSPRLLPSSPIRLAPPGRLSEDSEDLDNYHFAIAPTIQETDAHSISFSDLGLQLPEDEDVWSDDGVTFHHGPSDSLHYVSADSGRYGTNSNSRRPPPSPTSLPFMAGNVRRRVQRDMDMVYPSGVHTIPVADQRALAKLGKDEMGKEEDAVVGIGGGQLESDGPPSKPDDTARKPTDASTPTLIEEDEEEGPDRSSTESRMSYCSLTVPEAVPPTTISSHIAFSKHSRTASYSDSELDFELSSRNKPRSTPPAKNKTQTAVAWRCGAGNHEKCCGTRAMLNSTIKYKCCAERTPHGKHAQCCAFYVGKPCQRPRVSSTSSGELKRQRSLHFATSAKGFFQQVHRPHTSHGKSTSSALLDDETRAMIQAQTQAQAREDPGPQSSSSAVVTDCSPPMSPASRHEFKAMPIISPAKLQDHLKEMRLASPPEPLRARSNTGTSDSLSLSSRSAFSSEDVPAPMRSLLPPRPRRNQVSLPTMSTTVRSVEPPRRYVQSITGVVGFSRPAPPPPPPPSSSSSSIASGPSLSSIMSGTGSVPVPLRNGLPPPRRDLIGRTNGRPIVSFISSRSAPTPTLTPAPSPVVRAPELTPVSSRESHESSRTVRRERSIPLREAQMSFLEFGVEEEEEGEEDEEEEEIVYPFRPPLHTSQSFLDLDLSRLSGDTMRETDAMFSRS